MTFTPVYVAPSGTADGLCGEYYDNKDFTNFKYRQVDTQVNFDWGTGSPAGIGSNTFSITWAGEIELPYTGNYTFYTNTNNGTQLTVDGVVLIDALADSVVAEYAGVLAGVRTAGDRVPVLFKYFENNGSALAALSWSSEYLPKQVIPQDRLYSLGCFPSPTVSPTASVTPTATRTGTPTASPSITPSSTPSSTPQTRLALQKSSDVGMVTNTQIYTYVLALTNDGGLAGTVAVWDTLDPKITFNSASPAPSGNIGAVWTWNLPVTASGVTSITLTVQANSAALSEVVNLFSARAVGQTEVTSAMLVVGLNQSLSPSPSPTSTVTVTLSATPSATPTPTPSPTHSPSPTISPTFSITATATASETPDADWTNTVSPTPSESPSVSPTFSLTVTRSPTFSVTPSVTETYTDSATPSATPSVTESFTDSPTPSATETVTETVTETATPSETPSVTETFTDSPTPSETETITQTTTQTATPSVTLTVTSSFSVSPTVTRTGTPSVSPSVTPSITPTTTITLSWTVTPSATPSATVTLTPTRTATLSPSFTASPTGTLTATPSPTPLMPNLSLTKSGPAQSWEGERVDYALLLSNAPGGGDATDVTVYESLPSGLAYVGPGALAEENYPNNDLWRVTDTPGLIARGPFTLAPGGSIILSLQADVRFGLAGSTINNSAWAAPVGVTWTVGSSAAVPVLSGIAPTRTITETFTISPTFTDTSTPGTPSATDTPTITPSFTITPNGTLTPTPLVPVLSLAHSLASDPNLVFVGRSISFTVQFSNAIGAGQALGVELYTMRDLATNNLGVSEDPAHPVLGSSGSGVTEWFWVNDDDKPASEWRRGPYANVPASGAVFQAPYYMKVQPAAAGRTLVSRMRLYLNGVPSGVSSFASVYVPLYTPTALVTNTPTPTVTPITSEGQVTAYPQPASDRLCLDYWAPASAGPGVFQARVYNAAFQLIAEVRDPAAVPGRGQSTCFDVLGWAPGVYVIDARQGQFHYPLRSIGVAR